ncbi:MAG: hypothetical protein ACYDC8_15400 [Gammaproteobacteria bacterium]
MKSAVLLRLGYDPAQPDLLQSLKMGVTVVKAPLYEPQALAKLWPTARAHRSFVVGDKLFLVSTGPILDQPDQVAVQTLERRGHALILQVHFTESRRTGTQLRRNVPWLPIIQFALPAALASGEYQVSVRWQPVESLPSGKLIGAAQTTENFVFTVRP